MGELELLQVSRVQIMSACILAEMRNTAMKRYKQRLGLVFCVLFLPGLAIAHHTFGYTFNTSQTAEIEGEVVGVQWTNPHIVFSMRTDDGEIWDIESNSPNGMERRTISQEIISVGNRFRLAGFPARDGSNGMHASNILLSDGREVVLRPGSEPRWAGEE
jgi:hypothetical protein